VTKILTPQQLAPVMEIARELLPPGMELVVVDPTKPEFYDVAADADVMVEEPPKPNHPLFSLPNVTLTPHSAGPTWDNWAKAYRNGFDNIQRVEEGRAPFWVVPELRS